MNHKVIFNTIVGSQSYGTSIETSDIDTKFIYVQDPREILGFNYVEQINVDKDNSGYEIRRALELLQKNNPTLLELLYSPQSCITHMDTAFYLLQDNADKFLTKVCRDSFGGYAIAQIKKAEGLDKHMNWEHTRVERKTPIDFCYVLDDGKGVELTKWLARTKKEPQYCGLAKINNVRDGYALYYDIVAQYGANMNRNVGEPLGYKGIANPESNELLTSSIPKDQKPICNIYWNREGYSTHCKDYNKYQHWLETRNEQRYVDNKNHDQKIDGKNMMHCMRLLEMAKEIATEGKLIVRRPNREYLLSIRRGEVNLSDLLKRATEGIAELDELYAKSSLPNSVDLVFVNELLLDIRDQIKF